MKRWYVVTPEYGQVFPILEDGTGPIEYGCDVIEVEADTRKDAIILGIKLMSEAGLLKYPWVYWARRDGKCPFTGVKAELAEDE